MALGRPVQISALPDVRQHHATTVGSLGYGHSIQRVSGAMRDGKTLDLTVRVTDVYRKIRGQVAHRA